MFYDDQTNPQTGVQLANHVIAAKPAVLLGSSLVAVCNAMAPLMQDGPAMYCFSPGIHPPAGSYVFTSSVSTLDLADAMIRYFRLKGWTRIALMTSADATGQDAEHGLDEVLARPENKDVTVVERAHFNITDVSVAAQIEHIKAANPQALIAWSTGTPIATVFKGIIQAGLDIPIAHDQRQHDLRADDAVCRLPAEAALYRRLRNGCSTRASSRSTRRWKRRRSGFSMRSRRQTKSRISQQRSPGTRP